MEPLARVIVLGAAAYFLVLGSVALIAPTRASAFLAGFAASQGTHLLELAIRVAVGVSFVGVAPLTAYAGPFRAFGGLLIVTTAGLACVPWQRHRAFAERHVPRALSHLPLIGVSSLVIGGGIVWAVLSGV